MELTITIKNIKHESDAQAIANMLTAMQTLGSIGSSRYLSIFADGDGSFHPKVDMRLSDGDITEMDLLVDVKQIINMSGKFGSLVFDGNNIYGSKISRREEK